MSDIKISVETTQAPGLEAEITIIRVDGVIDTMTATELEKVTNSLLGQRRYNIIVDLGGVDYISSAGWGIFISNIREIRLNNGDIKLARMIPNVYEIFELLEFDSILKAFDNIEKAKNDFGGSETMVQPKIEVAEPKPVPVGEKAIDQSQAVTPISRKPFMATGDVKDGENTEIRDEPDPTSQVNLGPPTLSSRTTAVADKPKTLDEAIMDVVGKDPFLSIGEIKSAILAEFPGTGFFKTWWSLRALGLNSKKKRFYFARTRRFSK
ncbi:MAG: STAS domain-containing protein [candidate division Zixibacteria bacterium]|nr:STAS domain-containing protein [candidate division Zixibacteria bacterium]